MSRRPRSALRPRYLKVHAFLVFLFLFAPIIVLIVFSFNNGRSGTRWTGFSTHWYSDLVDNHDVKKAFGNTMKVALVATAVATIMGTLAAFALARFRFRGKSAISTLLFVSLVMPEVIMGLALLVFFRRIADVQLGINTIIMAHITFCIAFVVVVVRARLAGFDNRLMEAAADLGATPLQTFMRIVLPLAAPGIAAGAMLAFTISLDDVVVSFFAQGPGSTTLPLYIFSQTRVGVSPSINALSTFVLVFSLLLLGIAALISARSARRGAGAIDTTVLG
jgi:spermidine/putrescine transport system permease protein